eukprot:7384244-Prymnesium_polylepis.1
MPWLAVWPQLEGSEADWRREQQAEADRSTVHSERVDVGEHTATFAHSRLKAARHAAHVELFERDFVGIGTP